MATNDTIEDIVAMLRRLAKGEELPTDEIPSFTSLADSIEAAWRRERKPGRNCDRFDGYLDAVKAFKGERRGVEVTIENVLYWLFQPIKKEVS